MSSYDEKYMNFWEHLEVLQWHIIRALAAILVVAVAAFWSKEFIFHILILGPTRPDFWTYRVLSKLGELMNAPALCINALPFTLQSRQLTGQFTMHLLSSLVIGLIGAFPYTIWELWRFVKPAIPPKKRSVLQDSGLVVSVLFMLGILFGYYIITPLVIHFLAHYQLDPSISNVFDITSYITTVFTLVLACAFMFQLPVAVYLLAKAGVVAAHHLRAYRKHAVVVILVVAAIITPPDVMSQILVALPLMLLYEFSILIAQFISNKEKTY